MFNFLLETFVMGLRNLHLHKLRSTLTALGIIIGVWAFIVMVAIGEGTKRAALEQMRQLGAENIVVRSVPPPASSDNSTRTSRELEYGIKRVDVDRLRALMRDDAHPNNPVVRIVPVRLTEQKVVRGDVRVGANAIGTEPEIFEVINLRLERGRYFTRADLTAETPVCVLGAVATQQLFPFQDPLGQTITVGSADSGVVVLTIIGVLEKTGLRPGGSGIIDRNIDLDAYFPLTLAQRVFKDTIIKRTSGSFERKRIEISEVWLRAFSTNEVEATAKVVENVLKRSRGPTADFEVKAPIDILRAAEAQQRQFNFIMVTISLFSLIVGGIGIMNIMLASVTERTREIGIRRALGAKRRHITLQFLIETTVISLSGGLAGIVIGCGFALSVPALMLWYSGTNNYPTQITSWSVVGSLFFSAAIGIGFGLYPAITAARMNPIEALRHE